MLKLYKIPELLLMPCPAAICTARAQGARITSRTAPRTHGDHATSTRPEVSMSTRLEDRGQVPREVSVWVYVDSVSGSRVRATRLEVRGEVCREALEVRELIP